MSTLLTLPIGAFAIVGTIATLTLIISFATVLKNTNLPAGTMAVVASVFGVIALTSISWLWYRHICHQSQKDNQMPEKRRKRKELLIGVTGILCFLYTVFSIATLVWMQTRSADLPGTILGTNTKTMLTVAFVIWAISSLGLSSFLIALIIGCRTNQHQQSLYADVEPRDHDEMQQTSHPQIVRPPTRGRASSDEQTSSLSGQKLSGSGPVSSIRSSITHVVRPISSKSRLVASSKPYRPASLDSGTGEREIIEDSFDSWDLSAVEANSRHFISAANSMNSSSPNNGRFLETIPASPTGSRSPSPGFPLDLEPPRHRRRRSRSHSPTTTIISRQHRSAASSPTGSEAHIHPLFRTDSPTPPPTATPGTVVTAAPGSGQTTINRQSVRRMRSNSLHNSPSPLSHSRSLDDMNPRTKEEEEVEESGRSPSPPEREMTPPIPDWVLGAGPRRSFSGYSRRKAQSLDPLGEAKES